MIDISVELANELAVKRFCKELPHKFNEVISDAVNDTATWLRREAKRKISEKLKIENDTKEYKMKIRNSSVTAGLMTANLIFRGGQIPLSKVSGTSQEKTGVRFSILDKAYTVPGTFFATMPGSKHRGIFERLFQKKKLPIDQLYTASIPQMTVSEKTDIPEELLQKAQETFEQFFVDGCEKQLSLLGAK